MLDKHAIRYISMFVAGLLYGLAIMSFGVNWAPDPAIPIKILAILDVCFTSVGIFFFVLFKIIDAWDKGEH